MELQKSPPIFATFWHGNPLGFIENLSLSSFIKSGFRVDLYSFAQVQVPDGVNLRSAEEVIDRSKLFANPVEKYSYAAFSNIFRYALLDAHEIIWIDSDVLCWDWQLPHRKYIFGFEDEIGTINGAVLGAPKGSELLAKLIRSSEQVDTRKVRWGQLGPRLLSKEIKALDLTNHALPKSTFYPVAPSEIWKVFDPFSADSLRQELSASSAVHLWNNVLRHAAPELKTELPPAGSLLGQLAEDWGIAFSRDMSLPDDWARSKLQRRLDNFNSFNKRVGRRLRNLTAVR